MFPKRFSLRRRNAALFAAVCYSKADDDTVAGGGGGDPPPEPKPKEKTPAAKKVELTEDELAERVEAARQEERQKLADDRKKEKDEADRKAAEKAGDFEKLAEKEKTDREAADQRAAAAERRAQLAEVNVGLRDHLAEKHPEYIANAADIMLHVEKGLKSDAKPADVRKLIADEAEAFVKRTPKGRIAPPPSPAGGRQCGAGGTGTPNPKNNDDGRVTISGMSSRF